MRKIATAQHWVDKNCWNFCMSLPFVCRICWSKKISWKFVFSKCPNFCRSIVTLEMAIDFFLIYYFKICIIQGFQKCIIHICPMLLRLVLIHQQGDTCSQDQKVSFHLKYRSIPGIFGMHSHSTPTRSEESGMNSYSDLVSKNRWIKKS